ncbi:MAG TPA: hypothetical protein VEH83_05095 [Gemmatimonadales bacterium]|nr:hypothetical protein [Gemmatimonadales bacterium]
MLFAAGCGSKDATGISANVTGNWGGTGTQGGLDISFMMTLQDSGAGVITGTGTVTTFTAGGAGYSYTVSGRRDASKVMMSFNIPGFISPIYTAGLTAPTTMIGDVNGSGFVNMQLRLDRN